MQTALEQVERLLDQLRTGPKNDEVCDKIVVLCRGYMEPSEEYAEKAIGVLRLTKSERRLTNALLCKLGGIVTKETLLNAITYDRIKDAPEMKIVDIWVCNIRKKMEAENSPYRIETVYGTGYRMVARSEPLYGVQWLNGRSMTVKARQCHERLINKSEQAKAA